MYDLENPAIVDRLCPLSMPKALYFKILLEIYIPDNIEIDKAVQVEINKRGILFRSAILK